MSAPSSDELVIKPWKRYGHDRLYVQTADGVRLGYWDNARSTATLEEGTDRSAFDAAVGAHFAGARPVIPVQPGPVDDVTDALVAVPEPEADVPDADLAATRPGAAAREQAVALREAAPVKTFFARVLGVKTDERAWRIGADAEEEVASRLAKLG
jgi:hypothetical protein